MNRSRIISFVVGIIFLGMTGMANGANLTFKLTYSGQSFGNSAVATGYITVDYALFPNPGIGTIGFPNPAILDLSITVSGASSGNGTFGLAAFSSMVWNTDGAKLDFSKELVGQLTQNGIWGTTGDFNLFSGGIITTETPITAAVPISTPIGTAPFVLTTNGGSGDSIKLTSMVMGISLLASDTVLYAVKASGIWMWNGSSWALLTQDLPGKMVVSGSRLYGTFGTLGLWMWDGSKWTGLTGDNPENMVAIGSTLYGDFGTLGLWKWDGSKWSQLTPDNPTNIVLSGSTLYGDFGNIGIWMWNGSSWSPLGLFP